MKEFIKTLFIICTIVLVLRGIGYAACPSWVPIAGTQYSMVAYGDVFVDGTKVDSTGFILAAFGPGGDSDCRAVNDVSSAGLGYLTIVGDVNDETISFKVCDSSTDVVSDVVATATFTDGETLSITFNATTGPPPCTDDANCADGVYCNGVETCVGGTCQPGTAVDCDDGVGCTDDSCDEVNDQCVNAPNDSLCNNGDYCDGVETCDAANDCQPGTAVDCSDGVGCTDDSCDEASDQCVNTPNDSLCNNGDYCDGVETCDAANDCQPGTAVDCGDGVGCTDDSCDEASDQCVNTPNDSLCDNGEYCDGVETCDATNDCQPGTAVDCDDSVACTDDSCDEANDTCVNDPNDALCDNGTYCDGVETCDATNDCQPGTAVDCDDGVGCTDDSCDEANDTCVNDPNDALCDNGLYCDGSETCDPNSGCQPGTDPCDDSVACTDDSCDEVNNTCTNDPNDAICDDADVCNGAETCDPNSGCQPGTALVCSDDNECTIDSCDPNTGCLNLAAFVNDLYATGQEFDGNSQIVGVEFGLDSGDGTGTPGSANWSQDNIVGLHLIDEDAVIDDPNNINSADLFVVDIRPSDSIGQTVAWYVVVDNAAADPNGDGYYPVLSWELDEFICTEVDGNPCVYALMGGLSTSGTPLVADMTDTNSYQTDVDSTQYFTILMTCEPEPVVTEAAPTGNIFPWPGTYPRGLGWSGLPFSIGGFPGGLPYPMTSGYAPGLSIPSFPGTYTGLTYPGSFYPWTSYPASTSYLPRFPATFPTLGIFSPVGRYGWPSNYWTGYPRSYNYQTGWFYTYYR